MRWLGILSLVFFSCGCEQKESPLSIPTSVGSETAIAPSLVYDYEKLHFFEGSKRGVHGEYLNLSYFNSSPSLRDIYYFEDVQNEEERFMVGILGDREATLSELVVYHTAMKNLRLLESTSNKKSDGLSELLAKLEGVEDLPLYLRVERIYTVLGREITPGNDGDYSTLIDLLGSSEGNCNSIAPAYFSVLNYFGVETYFRFGKLLDRNGDLSYHAWLSVETELGRIDIDPTWYGDFVPLAERNPKILLTTLDDHFLPKSR